MILRIFKTISKYRYIIIVYFSIIAICLTALPKEFNHSFDGVKYRLGSDEIIEEMKVSFEGDMIKPVLGRDRFQGAIIIDEEKHDIFELKFDEFNSSSITGLTKSGASYSLGKIYFDKSFTGFTITLMEKKGSSAGGWNSKDGLMFTTSAEDRIEAIRLANNHMQKLIDKKGMSALE